MSLDLFGTLKMIVDTRAAMRETAEAQQTIRDAPPTAFSCTAEQKARITESKTGITRPTVFRRPCSTRM
jgi:hypothetical protein